MKIYRSQAKSSCTQFHARALMLMRVRTRYFLTNEWGQDLLVTTSFWQ